MHRPWRLETLSTLTLLIAVISLFFTAGCARKDAAHTPAAKAGVNMVTIKGSDTMVHLVSSWAEDFMKTTPDIQVSVTGGGSGTGISALMNGTTDIASSSRDLSDKEKTQAAQKGLTLKEIPVGLDGLSVIANPSNPVKALSLAQLKDIFTGKITTWKAVGGPDMPILVYSRESSSGTYAFFQEHVLQKQNYTKSARLMPASSGIVEAVAADEGGLGYVGLDYAEKAQGRIHILGVKPDAESTAVMPTVETVQNKSYPIARELYLIVPGKPSEAAQKFVTYAISKEGQNIVQQSGYIPVQHQ
ncbi:MAG TPA: phosphate ABC transporter substrate-binding protein [Coleofasciculaceae cyanobacterium]|jgi:phosphate transport system substrate-binding protein